MLTLFLLAACSIEPSAEEAAKPKPAAPAAPAPEAAAPAASTTAATAPTTTPAAPSAQIEIAPGTGVKVAGVVNYDGPDKGTLRLDVAAASTDGGVASQRIVFAALLDKPGPFEIEVPKDVGPVTFTAFLDANGDGPGPGEPVATVTGQSLGSTPLTGLTFALVKAAGTPAPAPSNAGKPPAAPPDGAPAQPGNAPPAAPAATPPG